MTFYGIRDKKTKNPLRISIFSNGDGDFCNECGARFETGTYDSHFYMVTTEEIAERALKEDPDWYNASLERPQWPSNFNPKDHEVFSVDIP